MFDTITNVINLLYEGIHVERTALRKVKGLIGLLMVLY